MGHEPPANAGAASEVDELVQRLTAIHDAISHARALGVPTPVPEPLYQACLAVVTHRDGPPGGDGHPRGSYGRSTEMTDRTAEAPRQASVPRRRDASAGATVDLARQVPLRQLLWQVITPGEEFTVADVTKRLAKLGAPWSANKVSNALGYWVSRRRLDRCRKGVYRYPEDPVVDVPIDDDVRRESPVGLTSRPTPEAGGKERHPRVSPTETRQAM